MTDTPDHIKHIQLKIWLSRPPEERLLQFILENDAWWHALRKSKKERQTKVVKNEQPKSS